MFELECKNPDEIILTTKNAKIRLDVANEAVEAGLAAGKIVGPGEFEIGDVAIRGISVGKSQKEEGTPAISGVSGGRTVYDVMVGNVHIGVIGGIEEAVTLDELGVADVLCTSSVRAVREIDPKVVIAMGNVDGMVTELKLTARAEKKFKLKNREALPAVMEVVALS